MTNTHAPCTLKIGTLRLNQATDTRAKLLKTENIVNTAALDPYVFIREAWMQRRNYLVNDGKVDAVDEDFNEQDLFKN